MAGVKRVLVLNSGSSTLKWALFEGPDGAPLVEGSDRVTARIGEPLRAILSGIGGFDAVGHRIVHGGNRFRKTTRIDEQVRKELTALVELDSLHMRPALAGIDTLRVEASGVPQFAVFDTAFHFTMPPAAGYALPFEWTERWGLRRFGFHGLSVAHAVARSGEVAGRALSRIVVCHLGSGCSVTAVQEGRSIDTTMGFTPLEGLVMATRCGSVDPGLLLHLQLRCGLSPGELSDGLVNRSGLLGVSGVSGDFREVTAAADGGSARAVLAYGQFVVAAKRAVGAMTAVLGGVDALVFTGGIGENSPRLRAEVSSALTFAGLALDDEANERAAPDVDVARPESRIRVLVIHAREDLVILREVLAALEPAQA